MTLVNLWCVQAIHQKILSLGFQDCHAKIRQVDCQETVGGAVVIQVGCCSISIQVGLMREVDFMQAGAAIMGEGRVPPNNTS